MNKKTISHIFEIGCSGLIGAIITIGFQYFHPTNSSFTFIYNGEEMVVTESSYTELVKENEILHKELLDVKNKLNELQAQSDDPFDKINNEHLSTPLTNFEYFSRNGNVQTDYAFDSKNNYDTVYPYCITPFDDGEVFIEYNIKGEYKNLSGEIYVTKRARFINPEFSSWDLATFTIYGDDMPLYTHTGFTPKDEPVIVDIDITDVKFLKIYFKNAHYYDTGMPESLIGFGNPMIK